MATQRKVEIRSTKDTLKNTTVVSPANTSMSTKTHSKKRFWTKKRLIIAGSVILLISVTVTGYAWWRSTHHATITKRIETVSQTATPDVKPDTQPSMLTGLPVEPSLAKRPTVGVVIENLYPDARPQSGLSTAGVVYEALAEGGITRYLAFYQEKLPTNIGPVRSIRTYFVDWGLEYDAPVVHAGGNIDALDLIDPLGLKNLDEFYNGNYFRRINSRYAPHNLYTTGDQVDQLMRDHNYFATATYTPWPRKDDAKSDQPNATTININFSYADYDAQFSFDPTTDSYLRSVRNQPDIDADNNQRIAPKTVIAMYMPTSYGLTRINEQTVIMQTVGTGRAIVFQDGVATEATWSKPSHTGRTTFTDSSGKPISLDRGQTWISVFPVGKTVTYN